MICHEQDAGGCVGKIGFELYPQYFEECGRPTCPVTQAPGFASQRQKSERKRYAAKQQQKQSGNTVKAKRKGGFVQSDYPR